MAEASRVLVVASSNPGKIRELERKLSPYFEQLLGLQDVGLESPEETAPTYEGNARLKSEAAALGSGRVSLADDSGLEVEALGGAPGVYSNRYAADPAARITRLLAEVAATGKPTSPARFVCVIALTHPALGTRTFEGTVEGEIRPDARGGGGFGYDPVFHLPDRGLTMAEIDEDLKNRISHRGRAVDALVAFLAENPQWARI